MRIEDADYVVVAQEKDGATQDCFMKRRNTPALYAAGVAVESLLRAYVAQKEPVLEAAHNLSLLLDASQISISLVPNENAQIYHAVSLLAKRGKNDLRYTSNNRLRRRLKKQKLDRGIRGDFLKENCRIALEAASTILRIVAPNGNRNHPRSKSFAERIFAARDSL